MGLYSLQPITSWNIISFILSKGQGKVCSQVHFYIELTSNVGTLTNVLACSSFLQHFFNLMGKYLSKFSDNDSGIISSVFIVDFEQVFFCWEIFRIIILRIPVGRSWKLIVNSKDIVTFWYPKTIYDLCYLVAKYGWKIKNWGALWKKHLCWKNKKILNIRNIFFHSQLDPYLLEVLLVIIPIFTYNHLY